MKIKINNLIQSQTTRILLPILVVGLTVFTVGLWRLATQSDEIQPSNRNTAYVGQQVGFDYDPTEFSITGVNDELTQTITELVRLEATDSNQPSQIIIKRESGFRTVSTNLGKPPLKIVEDNLQQTYPSRYDNFSKTSQRSFFVDGNQSMEIIFTYTNQDEKISQKFIAVEKDLDTLIYVSMQSKKANFNSHNAHTFQPLLKSFKIY